MKRKKYVERQEEEKQSSSPIKDFNIYTLPTGIS